MNDRKQVLEQFEKNKEFMDTYVKAGIEQNRKGFAKLKIKKDGKVLSNARIMLSQKTHEFKYGANLFMLDGLETPEKNEQYKKYFAECFNMATLPFYWSGLEPKKGKPRYTKDSPDVYRRPNPDLCMEFCEQNGIEPREHALAYTYFYPQWLSKNDVWENKREMERFFREVSERYANRIPTIEIANEMFWDRELEAFPAIYFADDFVEFSFKLAQKYFPSNQLVINECSDLWEEKGISRDKYYQCIENALLKGARIDAIGLQFHMFFSKEEEFEKTKKQYNPKHVYKILDRYSAFEKPVQITEVTIPAYSNSEEDERIQAELVRNMYSLWFSHPNVEQIIYWNLVDGYAAYAPQGDMTAGENYFHGGLLRFDFTPKPAYYVIKDLFEKEWHTEISAVLDENGETDFHGFYGKYDVVVEYEGNKYTKELNFGKNGIREFTINL